MHHNANLMLRNSLSTSGTARQCCVRVGISTIQGSRGVI
jgi:hypothetical protein